MIAGLRPPAPTWLFVIACALAGCSIDPDSNPYHRSKCGPDEQSQDGFCVVLDGGAAGNGNKDAGGSGAGASGQGGLSGSGGASGSGGGQGGTGGAGGGAGGTAGGAGASGQGGTGGAGGMGDGCEEGDFCYEPGVGVNKATAFVPKCRAGGWHCENGKKDSCLGQIIPTTEICNGLDDDCDMSTDEEQQSSACEPDLTAKGRCQNGVEMCEDGRLLCHRNDPLPEVCNGEDDDCDGSTDEGTDEQCYPDATAGCTKQESGTYTCDGLCKPGMKLCQSGALTTCTMPMPLTPANMEQCTSTGVATDEDCDAKIDEGCPLCTVGDMQDCYSADPATLLPAGVPCKKGKRTCVLVGAGPSTEWGACMDEVTPSDETCANNGLDDDCDGTADDVPNLNMPCTDSAAKGVCRSGVNHCVANVLTCETPASSTETCDNLDDDCDGSTDEAPVMLQTDEANCGTCGNTCGTGDDCCAGKCTDPQGDELNCGQCGQQCGAGLACCAGGCVSTQSDENNCGGCNIKCSTGKDCCGASCLNLKTDNKNCGACGNVCGANQGCCNGTCKNILSDPDACSSACKVCPNTGLLGINPGKCVNGVCK